MVWKGTRVIFDREGKMGNIRESDLTDVVETILLSLDGYNIPYSNLISRLNILLSVGLKY